ncbi:heme biosynthesis HemY N-terminal domain-containing protein [Candidatus Liberibacter africanus]|uniref:heme biosynthesis HemY N-terminal domain-containing protein n=1 Tax=Liberibacter africanus TaxID=34020 RepID=UPI001FD47931|nr:heme biosynthesis HemY N-terminal domain-containing protein [Candidatus Liberibacter africanus]
MLRFVYYFCMILLMACSFAIVSYYPDGISIIWGNKIYQTSTFVVLLIAYLFLLALMVIFSVSRFFLSFPSILVQMFRKRTYDKECQTLCTSIISIAAQNIPLARKMFSQISQGHISHNKSLVNMLEVQINLADKQYNVAREKLEMMLHISSTREFAIYTLYLESRRIGDLKSAQRYAKKL